MKTLFIGSITGLLAVVVLVGNAHAGAVGVPEIDPGGAVTTVSLLAGLVALAGERLRRK